jgi:hypothetical protein
MSSSNFLIKRRGNVVAALVKQHDAASLAEALLEKKAENLELQEQLVSAAEGPQCMHRSCCNHAPTRHAATHTYRRVRITRSGACSLPSGTWSSS